MWDKISLFIADLNDSCGKPICASNTGIPTSTNDIGQAFVNFSKLGLTLLGLFAVLALVIAGLQYVTSAGNPQKTKQAREAIVYALVGIAFAVGAYGIVMIITANIG